MLLAVIRPGPVLKVYRDGAQVVAVPLTMPAALTLAADVLAEASAAISERKADE